MSPCDSPIDQLSNFVTHFIQLVVEILPSYIWDSKDFLQPLESLQPLPENAILVTADVTSLCTNIPHKEGIESVLHYMKLHTKTLAPDNPSHHAIRVLCETIQQFFVHGQAFPTICWHSHGNQGRPTICQPLHGSSRRNHPGSLYLGNPFLEEIHRWYLPDLSRHHQTI